MSYSLLALYVNEEDEDIGLLYLKLFLKLLVAHNCVCLRHCETEISLAPLLMVQ